MAGKVVAILGATGVVGRQMLQCLEERAFPVERLVPLASARSAGKTVTFRGEQVEIREAVPEAFEGIDATAVRVPAGVTSFDFVVRAEPSKIPASVEDVEIWKLLVP